MKTRFCPSPTGLMHLGNARTALFNYLASLSKQGELLLRIEDTDQSRSTKAHADELMADLSALGIEWQEGPFYQSKRADVYAKYYATLITQKHAYPCFCSDEQLALNRKMQRAAGLPPRYPGTCQALDDAAIEARLAQGEKPTLRFAMPTDETITFTDLVRGEQRFASSDIGDFIIRRADGSAPFMFSNAVDDATMGVSHAFRGEDHLTNTPRQIMLLKTLGLPVPTYAHIALINGPDGQPLSKRNGSRSIQDLLETGYLPLALVNYMARLGHYFAEDDLFSLAALAQRFDVKHLSRSPARFDPDQLERWQKEAVLIQSSDALWQWFPEEAKACIPEDKRNLFTETIQPNCVFPKDATLWAHACFDDALVFGHEEKALFHQAGIAFFEQALAAVAKNGTDFKALTEHLKTQCKVKGKALFMPLRVALTGLSHGPEMPKLLNLIGQETAKHRFEAAMYAI